MGCRLGFAVLSSDAGHTGAQNPLFGLDPQARLDYGYQAVGSLTPMAKQLVRAAYGRGPDRSYIAGGSNGGRHTLVASARYADQYDGFFAVAPGFNLPLAALAQIWGLSSGPRSPPTAATWRARCRWRNVGCLPIPSCAPATAWTGFATEWCRPRASAVRCST